MLIPWPSKERSFQNLLEYIKFQKSLTLTACLFKSMLKISFQFASFTLVENLVSPHTKPRIILLSITHLQSCTVFICASREDDFWPGLWDFNPTRLRSLLRLRIWICSATRTWLEYLEWRCEVWTKLKCAMTKTNQFSGLFYNIVQRSFVGRRSLCSVCLIIYKLSCDIGFY